MAFINTIGTALPLYRHNQLDILRFMLDTSTFTDEQARKLSLMYRRSGVQSRHSVLKDYGVGNEERTFYPQTNDLEPFPTVTQRMAVYENEALPLAKAAILDAIDAQKLNEVTHLITVSCTGLMAPGLDVQLVEALKLSPNVVRTSVNFMGCYAALHALKIADAFCKSEASAQVLVVCVELCTLHFQKANTPDFQVSNLLFGDGAAACWVSNQPTGYEIKGFYATLALQGKADMAWQVSETGFLMTLSNHVPKLIENGIAQMVSESLRGFGISPDEVTNWAVHPGGKSILEAVQKALNISKKDLGLAYEILAEHGNMSSATILFLLKKMAQNAINPKENTFAVAFGPGLTMESMILSR